MRNLHKMICHDIYFCNVWFQKISILPPQKGLEFPGRRGVSKTQKFKAMYKAKLEFPEGWGGIGQIPSMGGYGYFLEPHNKYLNQQVQRYLQPSFLVFLDKTD